MVSLSSLLATCFCDSSVALPASNSYVRVYDGFSSAFVRSLWELQLNNLCVDLAVDVGKLTGYC